MGYVRNSNVCDCYVKCQYIEHSPQTSDAHVFLVWLGLKRDHQLLLNLASRGQWWQREANSNRSSRNKKGSFWSIGWKQLNYLHLESGHGWIDYGVKQIKPSCGFYPTLSIKEKSMKWDRKCLHKMQDQTATADLRTAIKTAVSRLCHSLFRSFSFSYVYDWIW